jgi:hypothetical protein
MSVYVDGILAWPKTPNWPFGSVTHMTTDDPSIVELHDMADLLKLRRTWFQNSPPHRIPHYDLSPGKREEALRLGAKDGTSPEYREWLKDAMLWWTLRFAKLQKGRSKATRRFFSEDD